jgi:DNA binding domain, excisionase family
MVSCDLDRLQDCKYNRDMQMDGVAADKLMFTVKEVADIVGVSGAYIRRCLATGDLRGEKLGYAWVIYRHDLETFITDREQSRWERGL